MIQHAEYISEKGNYRVVVPDLYRGKTGVDAEEASHVSKYILYISKNSMIAFDTAMSVLFSAIASGKNARVCS